MGLTLDSVPADGGPTSVNVAPGHFYGTQGLAEKWTTEWIPMDRLVGTFDENGRPHVFINFPLGNVADPNSPHFDDRLDDWLKGEYRELLFDRADIVADAEKTITLDRNPPAPE